MTAAEVKDALRGRHPGDDGYGGPGAWTCIEEFNNIDLLAFSAWGSQGGYARIGYEVKVSRSDMRQELLKPSKRSRNVEWCNEFYFAVPKGLLKPEELAFEEPEVEPEAFVRERCPEAAPSHWMPGGRRREEGPGPCHSGKREHLLIGPLAEHAFYRPHREYPCQTCGGKGYMAKSLVEREWPTLWVPRDVGLIEVDGNGARCVKKAPKRKEVAALRPMDLGQLVRWVSFRPDPRHLRQGQARPVQVAA